MTLCDLRNRERLLLYESKAKYHCMYHQPKNDLDKAIVDITKNFLHNPVSPALREIGDT
jgi:hypothetical protein